MEQLKSMKEVLMAQTQGQIANLEKADYHELGAAIDMIKDIAETEYYCSVVRAMEEAEEKPAERYYYTERYMPIPYQRGLAEPSDRTYGRMWYDGSNSEGSKTAEMGGSRRYIGRYYDDSQDRRGYYMPVFDPYEGRSPSRRKMYMESKETHQSKEKQIQELESYMSELSSDITDMIHGATPEERQILQKKLAALVSKIDQVQ